MSFLFKKSSKPTTRLFYATDIHGSERTYRKFVNAGKFYGVNVLQASRAFQVTSAVYFNQHLKG